VKDTFHIYVRRHANDWYTVAALDHSGVAAFGPALPALREQLREALSQELTEGRLQAPGTLPELERRVLEVRLKAVQHERLIEVPMRFTLLVRATEPLASQRFEVWIPRLGRRFNIRGADHIAPWAEEIVRGFFHLEPVTTLLEYEYERGESVERLDVTWNPRRAAQKQRAERARRMDEHEGRSGLTEVGVELVEEARQGRVGRAHYRDEAVRQLIGILDSPHSRAVLLTGPSGVGKTALVHELAHRIALGTVPPSLQEVPVWHITGGRIIAGMKYLGQWQERCLGVVQTLRNTRGVLFADNLLELLLAGSTQTGHNVGQFLLPFIQSGELAVVAESTPDAMVLAQQLGPSLVQAFRRLPVASFTLDEAFNILEASTARLEKEHRVVFSPVAINRALDVLARFGAMDALPGAGLTLIEQMARVPRGQGAARTPDAWGHFAVEAADAITAFSRSAGFPEALIDPDQLLDVNTVSRFFTDRVVGQSQATELLTNLILVIKSSLNDPERPLGSFLFMGPTGVGKTESALTLADYLFGDRARVVRFDMSEYGYPGSASRLVGGSRGEGELTRKVREQPFSVLLLDEVEKADPEVFDILLQVLGEGRLTDGTGRTVRFTHTIVIMTSNLGAGRSKRIGMGGDTSAEAGAQHYREAAQAFFRPEFVNRIDFLVPFTDLVPDALRTIAQGMLGKALGREGFLRRGIAVTWEPTVVELLMKHGFDPRFGARPMKRAVEQQILVPLSRRLVLRGEATDEKFHLYVHDGRVAVVSSRQLDAAVAPRLAGLVAAHDALFSRGVAEASARLQRWDESPMVRGLREGAVSELPAQLGAVEARLHALGARAVRPSALASDERAAFEAELADLDDAVEALEWDLCLAALPRRDAIALVVDAPSGTGAAVKLAVALAEHHAALAHGRGWAVRSTREGAAVRLDVDGPFAGIILAEELGVHRFLADDITTDLVVTGLGQEPDEEVVREYTADPPSIWDPAVEAEAPGGLDALTAALPRFLLARLARRASTVIAERAVTTTHQA